jgi:hypothetical protein
VHLQRPETHFDPGQLDVVTRILKKAGVTDPEAARVLAGKVAATMSQHVAEKDARAMPDRQIHDRLRALIRLAEETDPPVGQIRAKLRELPNVLTEVEERAERRWQIYLRDRAPAASTSGWLANVPADQRLIILPRSVSTGGMIVPGRGRGDGRHSRPQFEPMIRGVVRGAPPPSGSTTASMGGRPRDDDALELISFLAMDWALSTESRPTPGRSDEKPFGDLVHQVFGWLGLPDATGALRRYWREWARRTKPSPVASD